MFLDETGLMLQPVVRRSWGPKSCPPVMYCWDRRDRLSVIGALSRAPRKRRIGLYFVMYERNVIAEEVEAFLRDVRRSLGRKVIVVMDRWAAHRKAAKALFGDKRFWIEWLPPYAPDLNPVDKLWGHTKHDDLANFIPDNLADLDGLGNWLRTDQTYALIRSLSMAAAAPTGELLPPLTVMRSMVSVR